MSPSPSTNTYIKEIVEKKWRFRFDVDSSIQADANILKTFIKFFMNNDASNYDDSSDITEFTPVGVSFTDSDFKYVTVSERVQYTIHRNNRFLLQLITNFTVVVSDSVKCIPTSLVEVVNFHMKKNLVVLKIGTPMKGCDERRFEYNFSPFTYRLIPRIASSFLYLSQNDSLPMSTLCRESEKCIWYNAGKINVDDVKSLQSLQSLQSSQYSLILTDSASSADPSKSIYFMSSKVDKDALLGKETQKILWKHYLTMQCPFKYGHRHNALLYVNFLALYLNNHYTKLSTIGIMYDDVCTMMDSKDNSVSSKSNAIVLIDNRFNYLSVLSVVLSLYNLCRFNKKGNEPVCNWNLYLYTSNEAAKKYRAAFKTIFASASGKECVNVEILTKLDCNVFHIEVYNDILKDASFWQTLKNEGHEKCIIIQDDGILMNGQTIGKFLEYDYVGAPWLDTSDNEYIKENVNPELVGNGGFSLRDVNKMQQVCTQYIEEKMDLFYNNINEIPEDVYFAKCLTHMGAKVAPFDVAREFSVEQVPCQTTVGFHKFWLYHHPQTAQTLFDNFLCM
jgi:hypothetical protein